MNLYLDVMKVRFEDKLQCTVSCGEEIEGAMVPQLRGQSEDRKVDVEVGVRRHDGRLEIHVTVCGPGPGEHETNGFGIGLKTIGARLERLYGDAGALSVDHKDAGGTRVRITLPFHREPFPYTHGHSRRARRR